MIYIPKFEESSLSLENNTDIHNNFSLPLATWHVITIYYTLKVLLGILGNSLVLHAFLYPDLLDYKKVSLVILTNLAVADFLVLLVMGLPTVGVLVADRWPFGSKVCHFVALTKHALFYIQVLLVSMLSAHRAYILTFPFKGMLITKRGAVKTAIVLWVVSITLNLIGIIGSEVTFFDQGYLSCSAKIYAQSKIEWEGYLLGSCLLVGSITLGISLFLIGWKARRGTEDKQIDKPPNLTRRGKCGMFLQKNKSSVTVISVAAIFSVSMVPVFLVHLCKYMDIYLDPRLKLTQEIMFLFNAVANPIIYSLTNPSFLRFYKQSFRIRSASC